MTTDIWTAFIKASCTYRDGEPEITMTHLDSFAAEFARYGGAVAGSGYTYEAQFDVDVDNAVDAAFYAMNVFDSAVKHADLPRWPVVDFSCKTVAEQERELSEPTIPTLLGVAELADLGRVSKQRASALAAQGSFPSPVQVLAAGPVWAESAVLRHAESWDRKPGRPRRSAD